MQWVRLLSGREVAVVQAVRWEPVHGFHTWGVDPPQFARPSGPLINVAGLKVATSVWVEIDGKWRFGRISIPSDPEMHVEGGSFNYLLKFTAGPVGKTRKRRRTCLKKKSTNHGLAGTKERSVDGNTECRPMPERSFSALLEPERLPDVLSDPVALFTDVAAFHAALMDSEWIWPRLGCFHPFDAGVVSEGDIWARVRPVTRTAVPPTFDTLRAEVVIHGIPYPGASSPVYNAHIAICLWSSWLTNSMAGIPLISYYKKGEDGIFRLSIRDELARFRLGQCGGPGQDQ